MKQLTILLCFVSFSMFAQTQIDSGQIRRIPIAKLVTPTTPTNGQVIKYNSTTGKWEPGTDNSGGSLSILANRVPFGSGTGYQTDPRILVDSINKAYVTNGLGTKLSTSSLQPGYLQMGADTTQDRQIFFNLNPLRVNSFTSAPFGLSVEKVAQAGTYPNIVWSMGPNLQGNSGVPFISTKPSMGISWETSYSDGGVATAEWHEHFKQPDSSNIRLKSYTIRYRNGVDPSRLLDVDFYQKVDRFYLKNPRTPDETYFAVSRSNTGAKNATMTLSGALGSMIFTAGSSYDGSFTYNGLEFSGTSPNRVFSFTGLTQFKLSNNTFWTSADAFTIPTVTSTNISVQNLDIGASGSGGIYMGSIKFLWAGTSQINFIGGYAAGPNRATVPSGGNGNIVIGYNSGNTIAASTRGLIALGTGSARSVSSSGTIAIGDQAIGQGNPAKTIAIGDSAMFSQGLSNVLWIENRYTTTGTTVRTAPLVSGDFANRRAGIEIAPGSLSAKFHLPAGTATASTAPLKFTSGTNLTTPEAGAIEYDGTEFYATNSGASRTILSRVLKGSATLDFGSTAAGAVTDLTITVTGAADGDVVSLSVPNASQTTTGSFSAWVSATNTVTVRYRIAALTGSEDPASGTFKVTVTK